MPDTKIYKNLTCGNQDDSAKCQVDEQTDMTRISVLLTHLTRENLMRSGRRYEDNINTGLKNLRLRNGFILIRV